jgi:hypothetical protein
MNLRERFDSLERKLDQPLALERAGASHGPLNQIDDSLEQADAFLRESEAMMERAKEQRSERDRAEHAARSAEVFGGLLNPPLIRLLVEENGSKLWRTVEGRFLLGSANIYGDPALGRPVVTPESLGAQWNWRADWYVIQAKSGKFIIYKRPADSSVGTIGICEDLAALASALPGNLFREATEQMDRGEGSRAPGYPELPLEGV